MLSAPPSGVAHIAAHVGCCRWPPHPYNFPTLEKRVHRKRNGIAVANQQPLQLDESFEIGVSIYIYNIYIYIPKNGICMEKVNSSTIRFSGTLCSVSHPLAVTRLPSPPCQILRPDGSLVVTAHQVDGPILIDPPQKSYTLITAFPGSNTVSSKTHPFAKKHEPSAKWVVEFATPHPIRIQ